MKKSTLAVNGEEISPESVDSDDSDFSDINQNGLNDFVVQATQASIKQPSTETEDLPNDDSDAPVGVSWRDSKAVFQQDEKNRNSAVNFARSVDKAKRRQKNEMFVSQKESKRKLTKLPEDIVQAIAKKPKQVESDKIEEESGKLQRRKAHKKKGSYKKKTEEYCHVVILQEEVNKAKKVQETAAEFLKNHLYGNRVVRTSGSRQLTMQAKSSGIMKPAVKFNRK